MNGEKKIWKPGDEPDEHHGVGGSYVVDEHGKRQLVEGSRTVMPGQGETEKPEAKE